MRTARLGDIAELVRGVSFDGSEASPRQSTGYKPILRAGNIQNKLDVETDLVWVPESRISPTQRLVEGDIAVCLSSGSPAVVGKTAILNRPFDGSVGAFCGIIRPGADLDANYVAHWLRSPAYWSWRDKQSRGAGIQNLRLSQLAVIDLPVPPLVEQQRLAELLTDQLAAVAATQEAASEQSQRSAQLRVTVVRDLIPLPASATFPIVPLSECVEFLDHRRRPINQSERDQRVSGKSPGELYPYYGANGQAGWIDDYLFDEPLVLLAEDGGAFGSPTRPIAYRIDGRTWVNNHAHVLRPLAHMDVDYLCHALAIRPDIADVISGSTRGKLNREVAGHIRVSVPPLPEQWRIAAELRERLAEVDAMTAPINDELEAIEALPAALLRRAFDDLAA